MGSFETEDRHASAHHRPVRVSKRKDEAYAAARELCEDLGWRIVEADEARHALRCARKGGWLGGESTIEVWIEGPDGLPSSTTYVRSRSNGGLFARDRANVAEFVRKLTMRTI